MTTETNDSAAPRSEAAAPPPAPAAAFKPGALIREARQAARLSVDDLAGMTKLARPTVEAMERDDFAALLEPVYARGYYRKCAKVLGLDEKVLLDAYAVHVAQRAPVIPTKVRLASGSELGIGSRLPMGRAIVVALGAVIVCALLWFVREATMPGPQLPPTMLPSGSAPNLPGADAQLQAPAQPATSAAPAASGSGEATAAAVPETTAPATAAAPAAGVPAPTATAPAATPAAAPATTAPSAPPVMGAMTGSGPLQLSFNADCWVSIRDNTGKTLLKGLVVAGQRIALNGQRPFFLFLGKASAVSVQFDGKRVDLAPYTRENATARLSLPAQAPTAATVPVTPAARAPAPVVAPAAPVRR